MDEKLETLETLLKSIKSKTSSISGQTKFLNAFNKKMEILLMCFEAYSIEETKEEKESKENVRERNVKSKENIKEINKEINKENSKENNKANDIVKKIKISEKENNPIDVLSENIYLKRLESLFDTNVISKMIGKSILDLIQSREFITLDDLVKGVKNSKYKVIEVLNVLIKERIIIKSFEKGFVYRISKEEI